MATIAHYHKSALALGLVFSPRVRKAKESSLASLALGCLLVGCALLMSSCAAGPGAQQRQSQGNIAGANVSGANVEVLTMLDVAREQIQATNLSFVVDRSQDFPTRERATYFFENYLSGNLTGPAFSQHQRGSTELLVSSTEASTFQYAVRRDPVGERVAYQVACRGPEPQASLNARNLARFMQYGVLELELLSP